VATVSIKGRYTSRREGQTERATHDELQAIINRRIESGYSSKDELDLRKHLEHLKILITARPDRPFFPRMGSYSMRSILGMPEEETVGDFIGDMIEQTKSLIAKTIGATYHAKVTPRLGRAKLSPK